MFMSVPSYLRAINEADTVSQDTTVYPSSEPSGLDGYDIYRNKTAVYSLWQSIAGVMDAKSGKNAK